MGNYASSNLYRKVKGHYVQKLVSWMGMFLFLGSTQLCMAQLHKQTSMSEAHPLSVDASASVSPAPPADYVGGTNRAPDGRVLGVTDRYLTLAGKPWIPVMGEMHYGREPEADWDADLERMKAAGVDVVSTYIIWIYHEEVQGQWDWSGQRDLRHFAQLCQKHGLLLMVRIGPWAHAETRNGGLPDWVVNAGPTRQMDPKFMAETRSFDDQIGTQLHGLMWKDGGPVIGAQIENEYAQRGPGKGAPYILALKTMAREAGLDVPLYTVTGWDNAVVPSREFLPVYGGYPAAPWGGTTRTLAPQEVYAFRFGSRVSGNMGMIGAGAPGMGQQAPADDAKTPFLTAEMGGGIQDTYHRRPVIAAADIAAMVPVMLGSGVNGYGTYMMVGGEDPKGKLTTLEESQATGYPTDVPVKSYDFQAPIGQFGLERPSLRLLKEWNYFMQDFGSLLAPMSAFAPAVRPQNPADLSVLRWSVRTNGNEGFVFVNNYVRGVSMPERHGVRFSITLPNGKNATLPEQPVDIPSGAFFAWPFGLQLGRGIELRYATAQLLARLPAEAKYTEGNVLFCLSGIRCELSLRGDGLVVQAPRGVRVEHSADGVLLTRESQAGALSVITVHGENASAIRLVLLSPEAAVDTWKLPFADAERLVQTGADVWEDEGRLALAQLGDPLFHFSIYPQPPAVSSGTGPIQATPDGVFRATVPAAAITARLTERHTAGIAPPVHLGPPLPWRPVGVAQAPDDAEWAANAATWHVQLEPEQMPGDVSNVFLRLQYVGDEARLVGPDGTLFDDNFWNGEPWLVGLHRLSESEGSLPAGLQLQVLPIRVDAPVYLSAGARARLTSAGQTLEVKSLEAVPEYLLHVQAASGAAR
jgi:beta-galactosidase